MDDSNAAKDGGNLDMQLMRERYESATDAEGDNRDKALSDLRFVSVPGEAWDEHQRKQRRGRPCYEMPILRSHWRQVVNDQKKARPGIKVRAQRDAEAKDADLRAGLIRNIEAISNAENAYDGAFELLTAGGFGAWRVKTEYSDDDAWELDLQISPIADAIATVWLDPSHKDPTGADAEWCFVEEFVSKEEFKRRWPNARELDFESAGSQGCAGWFANDGIRIAEYYRVERYKRQICLLTDGRSVDYDEVKDALDEMAQSGITIQTDASGKPMIRQAEGKRVVMSIVSGVDELEGPYETVFTRIPIITVYANRKLIEGKWHWCGMVRFSRDPQKLVNYNFTTAQELLAKQPKAPYLVTPKMLEGAGVKKMWDKSNAMDAPYLPYTPDPAAPNSAPTRQPGPEMPAAFTAMSQMAVDMLKASDGIYDASVGARSNETSGRAILARQQEGDTATFDYQDALNKGIQATGRILGDALPKVYDTPRQVRIMGRDGSDQFVQLYEEVRDQQTGRVIKVNDLSKGKYDYAVTTGPSYDTQRMEFVDALVQLGQGNPMVAQSVPDLIVGSMDFPKADEAAERLKLLLPAPVQQALAQKDQSPAVVQLQSQMQQMQQQAQQQLSELQQQLQQAQAKASSKVAEELKVAIAQEQLRIDWYEAETARLAVFQKDAAAAAQVNRDAAALLDQQIQAEAGRQHDIGMAHLAQQQVQDNSGEGQAETV
ncbi:portal protein [Pseudoxanthomonas sp.]|uniref:portal protein n=1 Tax=Pseudoxanthomonas sp. TaxID=1871049 RepID=UPI00260CB291|nr:portal protein [Pseudoxanthomonas sp.]WDS36234.1 MAG: portal protein [Pseudoxanthomonas sp.]